MASRISQMRNAPVAQQPLNDSVQQVKYLMNTIQASGNPQMVWNTLLSKNPQLANLAKQPNLQSIAEQMAREKGIDLDDLVRQLQGG